MTPLVEARGLEVRYRGRPALRGVDLTLAPGRIAALVGPSGSGKSSFLRCLNRLDALVDGCEVLGALRFDGRDLLDPRVDLRALRCEVGMIFQQPNPFPLSIRANLELPLREHGLARGRGALADAVEGALRRVGLWEEVRERLGEPADRLSGGQQQRLCIARALTLRPRLMLLDEPCSALDPIAAERIEGLIRALAAETTPVVVTHNLAQARRLADDLLVFWHRGGCGELIERGPAAEVFASPRDPDAAAYLRGDRG